MIKKDNINQYNKDNTSDYVLFKNVYDKLIQIIKKELPGFINERIMAQSGSFIINGLNEEYNDSYLLTSRLIKKGFILLIRREYYKN